jgi:hypothetical protein
VEDVTEISATARIAANGDGLDDAELSRLMDRVGAGYVYVGPANARTAGKLSAARLRRHPELFEVYGAGGAWVFERHRRSARGQAPATGRGGGVARAAIDRPAGAALGKPGRNPILATWEPSN